MESVYLLGRGDIFQADRDADGNPEALQDLGECPEFEVSVDVEFADNFNTKKAISRQDLHVAVKQTGKIRIVAKEATANNLALALFGEVVSHAGGAFVDVPFPAGIANGETHIVPGNRANLSGVTLEDSAGGGGAPVAAEDVEIDLKYGTVKFIDVAGYTQPFKISGNEAAGQKSVALLKKRSQEKFIFFKGINVADDDKAMIAGLYRVALGPAQKLAGKSDEPAMFEFEGAILSDDEKDEDATLGTFGYYRILE